MPSIPELLKGHVTLEVECLDRLYLNGYIGLLATSGGLVTFMREQLGKPIPSPVVLGQVTERFRDAVKALAERQQIPIYQFDHRERKDDVANRIRQQRGVRDGIVFIGVAQEKAQAFQGKKINGQFEFTRDKTVYVNHYYFYLDDAEFGPLFLKVCSYAPWATRLCLNGHEWAKRQLEKEGIVYEALDNGFLSCADPERLREICDSLGPEDIDRLFRKWLKRIPLPLRPEDRSAGYDWSLSIWQMEVSLTQIFDRPLRGREFFEEIIRDNLDLGRPDRVQLIFDRVVTKKTPGAFRTRVIQDGVHPSLHIQYKNFDLKQYFKEGRGCRTEGTFRNPNDFGVNKGLSNLPYLRKIGHEINRRLLEVERVSHNSGLSGDSIQRVVQPTVTEDGVVEIRAAPCHGAAAGFDDVPTSDRRISQSRSARVGGRPARRHHRAVHRRSDDLRSASPASERTDLPPTADQPLLRHAVRLEGGPPVLPVGGTRLPTSNGPLYCQRRRSALSPASGPGSRRRTTRPLDLRRLSRTQGQLKT